MTATYRSSRSIVDYHEAALAAMLPRGEREAQVRPADVAARLDRTETEIWESIEWLASNGRAAYVYGDPSLVTVIRRKGRGTRESSAHLTGNPGRKPVLRRPCTQAIP